MDKKCVVCGDTFEKRPRDSARQWSDRAFCSLPCANKLKKDVAPHVTFWKYAGISDGDNCWLWHGLKDSYGYGVIDYRLNRTKAHRLSFEMRFGMIPEGYVVRHKCDNPSCVNPLHLESGTQKENMQDASKRGRLNSKSLENLRPGKRGFHGAGPKSNGETKNGR
jgi:hypothetical protein